MYFSSKNALAQESLADSRRILVRKMTPRVFDLHPISPQLKTERSHSKRSVSSNNAPSHLSSVASVMQEQPEQMFKGFSSKSQFVNLYAQYSKVDWSSQFNRLYQERLYHQLTKLTMQRSASVRRLFDDFVNLHWAKATESTRQKVCQVLFSEFDSLVLDTQKIMKDALLRIPQKIVLDQEQSLFELFKTLLLINDPQKCFSFQKAKQLQAFYSGGFADRKNHMRIHQVPKIRPMFEVLQACEMQLKQYKKEVHRLQLQLKNSEATKLKLKELLESKSHFVPVEVDYQKIKDIKQMQRAELMREIQTNVVVFYREQIDAGIGRENRLRDDKERMQSRIEELLIEVDDLKVRINNLINQKPQRVDFATQLFLLPTKKIDGVEVAPLGPKSHLEEFLSGFVSPFTFNRECTAGLINLIVLDKFLWDFQSIKTTGHCCPLRLYLYEWFAAKTGCRKVAQILCKNFVSSIQEHKRKHKRFQLFAKLAGLTRPKNKKMQEDLDLIFHTTNYAWLLFMRTVLVYRRKLTDGLSGYPILAPLSNEDLARIPLRKSYEVLNIVLKEQGLQQLSTPQLNSKFDMYAINQIARFRMTDQKFVREPTQQIHILKEITVEVVAGFILEYIAQSRQKGVQKVIRAVDLRQKEKGTLLTLDQFQLIFKKSFKVKRHVTQKHFAKLCLRNMEDVFQVENYREFAEGLLQDQVKPKAMFNTIEQIRNLTQSEKVLNQLIKRKNVNPQSYQFFKEKFHHQFYDFYHSTIAIEQLYRSVRQRITKMLAEDKKLAAKNQEEQAIIFQSQVQGLGSGTETAAVGTKPETGEKYQGEGQAVADAQPEQQDRQQQEKAVLGQQRVGMQIEFDSTGKPNISLLRLKHQQFRLIYEKVPSFSKHFITMDQILVNPLRRQQFYDVTQHCWKVLRQLLMLVADRLQF